MYEHPYLAYRVTAFEQEQAAELAERRRVLMENTDRIRPRAGMIARMLRAVASRRTTAGAPRRSQADAAAVTTITPTRTPAEQTATSAESEVVAA